MQLRYLNHDVPELLYHRLAEHIPEVDAISLESAVLRAAYHASAYVDRKWFSVARKPVYQVCPGNVREQCAALQGAEAIAPSDPILAKVRALLRLGYPMACIEQAFALMREARSWSQAENCPSFGGYGTTSGPNFAWSILRCDKCTELEPSSISCTRV